MAEVTGHASATTTAVEPPGLAEPVPVAAGALDRVHALVPGLYRNLLQFTVEVWPWSHDTETSRLQTVQRIAEEQQAAVGELVDWLLRAGVAVDVGQYPTEYTDLHYVSLEFLLRRILAEQQLLAESLNELTRVAPANSLLAEILTQARDQTWTHLTELRRLQAPPGANAPVA